MQTKTLRTVVLLAGALSLNLAMAAQQRHVRETNAAVVFDLEHGQLAQTGTPGFWLKGGAADVSITLWRGLGIAANLTGEHASTISNNVNLGKVAIMAGPRYTFSRERHTQFFGECLFGGVHAFDSTFPGTSAVRTSANAFSMQAGGGADIVLSKGFGIRAIELDWVHTNLPNNAGNKQNDLRLAFGISWRK